MNNVKNNLSVIDPGMVHHGYCECDDRVTTKHSPCDATKHPHCIYVKGQKEKK